MKSALFSCLCLLAAWPASAQVRCGDDAECARGNVCVGRQCGHASPTDKACDSDAVCDSSQRCWNRRCAEWVPQTVCTPGQTEACYEAGGSPQGECRRGERICGPRGTWGACAHQRLPTAEACDGLDTDCDGRVDEGLPCECTPGAVKECYSGPRPTLGVGVCRAGRQACTLDHRWGACLGAVLPSREACNGADDDCNGQVDDGCECLPGAIRTCYASGVRDVGACQAGHQACGRDARWSPCYGALAPGQEVCDRVDNDCDGRVDEGIVMTCASLVPPARPQPTPVPVQPGRPVIR